MTATAQRVVEPERVEFAPSVRAAAWRFAWLGPAVSLAILAAVLSQVQRFQISRDAGAIPHDAAFWAAFLAYLFASPIGDWVIFRRLWSIPASGMIPLLRKHVTNHLLFGYLGEVYFYGWARQNAHLTAAPFGAIKDVAILSAVCGNIVAVALLPLGIPLVSQFLPHHHPALLVLSVLVFSAVTLAPLLLGRRIFTLDRTDLRFVARVQTIRAVAAVLLYALVWHRLMPGHSSLGWLLLAALRQVVTRLPFIPDDEIVFTAIATFFLGHETRVASMAALIGSISLAILLALGAILGAMGIFERERKCERST